MLGAALAALATWPLAAEAASHWRTVAGLGKSGFGGNTLQSEVHGFAVETRLNSPWGLALDSTQDLLYIADTLNNVVRSVDLQTGLMETIAGTGAPGFAGDGGAAALALLSMPTGLALHVSGRVLYLSDTHNHCVRAVVLRPGIAYQAEGTGASPASFQGVEARLTCDGAGPDPVLLGSGYCDGSTGDGYAAYQNSIEDRIDFTVDAAEGAGDYELRFRYSDRYGHDLASSARRLRLIVNGEVVTHMFSFQPTGLHQAGNKNSFSWAVITTALADGDNTVSLEVTGQGGPQVDLLYVVPPRPAIWTIAGVAGSPGFSDDPAAPQLSQFRSPLGLAIDEAQGYLYVADADNGLVRRLSLTGTSSDEPSADAIVTVAGAGAGGNTRDGISALASKLFRPVALALDATGRYLYVADAGYNRVRRVDLDGDLMTTVCASQGPQAPSGYTMLAPHGLVFEGTSGLLLIAERGSARLRVADVDADTCTNDYSSLSDVLDEPQGLAWDPRDRAIYASQMKRHRVLRRSRETGDPG